MTALAALLGAPAGRLDALAPEATLAVGDARRGVRRPWAVATGARQAVDVLDALLPEEAVVDVWVQEGAELFAEAHAPHGSVLVSAQTGESGAIGRAFVLRAVPFSAPSPTWTAPSAGEYPDARPILDTYFGCMTRADFAGAAACFTEDLIYDHPPFLRELERSVYRSRAEMAEQLTKTRGAKPDIPVITVCVQRGPDAFVEGVVDRIPNGGTFVSSLSISPEGLIARYTSIYVPLRIARPSQSLARSEP